MSARHDKPSIVRCMRAGLFVFRDSKRSNKPVVQMKSAMQVVWMERET